MNKCAEQKHTRLVAEEALSIGCKVFGAVLVVRVRSVFVAVVILGEDLEPSFGHERPFIVNGNTMTTSVVERTTSDWWTSEL